MKLINALAKSHKPLIFGMIHLRALPGTPFNNCTIDKIVDLATKEAKCYAEAGLDGIIIENMGDLPYVQNGDKFCMAETVACMTACAVKLKNSIDNNCVGTSTLWGVNMLASRNHEALSVALAAGLDFIRCEGFVFGHIADEGYTDACAGQLLRYRKNIGAEHISILADIKKKHSAHAITADVSLVDTAQAAKYFHADGVIVTGSATGKPADKNDLSSIQLVKDLPVFVGSGVTKDNLDDYLSADGLIVGSYFKQDGYWANEVDENRIKDFMDCVVRRRSSNV